MRRVRLQPATLAGTVSAPPSKSGLHRAMLAAFLAGDGAPRIVDASQDITATVHALAALERGETVIDCRASGTTLRLLLPVAAALGRELTFTGTERLWQRPLGGLETLLPAHGVTCERDGLSLTIRGKLTPGEFRLRGDSTSQSISGLLLALPLLAGDSELILTTPLVSAPYVDMTLDTLKNHGITVMITPQGYRIPGGQRYRSFDDPVEGDWSQAAFFLAGGALTGDVTVTHLEMNSRQGDKKILSLLRRFGAAAEVTGEGVRVKKAPLCGCDIDARDIPDLAPALAVLGAYAEGTTRIFRASHLRHKESDRIQSMLVNLRRMGVDARETADGLCITGGAPHGAAFDSFDDHRIAMAMSIAALGAQGASTLDGAESIQKSYPAFFAEVNRLGGRADVIGDWE